MGDHETNAKHAQLTYDNENNKLKENIANLQDQLNGLAAKYRNDMQSVNMQGNELIQNANNEKAMLLSQLENLKQASIELEPQKHDISALYEREKMLWTSKNEFLENQKNEKGKELEEYQTNFTQAMSKMNQKGQSEK